MSLGDQFKELQSNIAGFRQELFGGPASDPTLGAMDDAPAATFACYYAEVSSLEQLVSLGFTEQHDSVLRVLKTETAFNPQEGKIVRLKGLGDDGSDLRIRLSKRSRSKISAEYVFGCKAIATSR